jgi:hypothetical protein
MEEFIKENITSLITFLVALIGAIPVIYGMFAARRRAEAQSEESESLAIKNITEAATGLLEPYRKTLLEMEEKIVVSDSKIEELQRLNREFVIKIKGLSGEKAELEKQLARQALELKRLRRMNKLLLEQLKELEVEPILNGSSEGEENGEEEAEG